MNMTQTETVNGLIFVHNVTKHHVNIAAGGTLGIRVVRFATKQEPTNANSKKQMCLVTVTRVVPSLQIVKTFYFQKMNND
jgi:hypothetical protein